MGTAGRTISASLKVTGVEKQLLESWDGKVSRALRIALDAYIASRLTGDEQYHRPAPAQDDDLAVLERLEPVGPSEVTTPCRIHRGYQVVKEWTEFGNRWVTKVCADCGYESSTQVHG